EEAMQSIGLKGGSSSLKIDQMGITMKAPMIKIEADAMFQAKGGAMAKGAGGGMLMLKGGVTMIDWDGGGEQGDGRTGTVAGGADAGRRCQRRESRTGSAGPEAGRIHIRSDRSGANRGRRAGTVRTAPCP